MSEQIQDILDDVEQLVSLPAACVRLNELVDDPTSSVDDISKVINQDVALTARLLRVANSPLYGFSTQIDTVTRAVTVLGTQQVRDLSLATAAVKTFDGIPNDLVSMDSFWEHSILTALCARTLAMDCLKRQREAVFVAGLLHDIGQLVLYHLLPDLSREALEACLDGPNELESQEAERDIIGFDHAEVGGELAHRWSLPTLTQECIAYHHNPEEAQQNRVETAIVHIANSIATLAELNTTALDNAPLIQPVAWKLTGLDEEVIAPTIASAMAQIGSARALLLGN
ncbi:MAG: HDOD domain-containing protein [Ectothiorhodospiraceae bacterium]|nr:HDOD domain-containing protein [Ectothiorhodospiraceae bacterium]